MQAAAEDEVGEVAEKSAKLEQGSGAARPGAGWVHVTLYANCWKCNFCSKTFTAINHTRVS